MNALLFKPLLGFREPQNLVMVWLRGAQKTTALSYADFQDYAGRQHSLGSMIASRRQPVTLVGQGDPQEIVALRVTQDFMAITQTDAFLGRGFLREEFESGRDGVFMATASFWRRNLGADPRAIGRPVTFDDVTRVLVGVFPPGFNWVGVSSDAIFVPLVPSAVELQRGYRFFDVIGRLRPGVSVEQARAEFQGITQGMAAAHAVPGGTTSRLRTVNEMALGSNLKTALWALSLTVVLVLLITCVNVANIKVSRLAERQREFAIRAALGASGRQVLRHLTVESLLEALVGGCVGLLLASWGHRFLTAAGLFDAGPVFDVRMDWRVAFFTLGISLLAGVIFGLLPAITVRRRNLTDLLKSAAAGSGVGGRATFLSALCVVVEVALAVVLLHGAMMALQNVRLLRAVNPGLETRERVSLRFSLPGKQYLPRQRIGFYHALLGQLEAVPGVQAAAIVSPAPLSGSGLLNSFYPDGRHPAPGEEGPVAYYYTCSPGYFSVLGIPVLAGREFVSTDLQPDALVAMVSRTVARRYWNSEAEALGRAMELNERRLTIVGVAGDVRPVSLTAAGETGAIYTPYSIYPPPQAAAIVRSKLPPSTLAPALRQSVWRIDHHLALGELDALTDVAGRHIADARRLGLVLGGCAVAALSMTLIGIYGVTAGMVAQRRREIAIRRALGASNRSLLWSFTRRGGSLAGLGLLAGAALAYAIRHAVASVVPPVNVAPVLVCGAALATMVTAILACILPAAAALRIQPERILRQE